MSNEEKVALPLAEMSDDDIMAAIARLVDEIKALPNLEHIAQLGNEKRAKIRHYEKELDERAKKNLRAMTDAEVQAVLDGDYGPWLKARARNEKERREESKAPETETLQ